jgi:hypothetical protein
MTAAVIALATLIWLSSSCFASLLREPLLLAIG